MKALVFHGIGEARLRSLAIGICGAEVHIVRGEVRRERLALEKLGGHLFDSGGWRLA